MEETNCPSRVREATSAHAFLSLLSPLSFIFGGFPSDPQWIFRGVSDSTLNLLPNAFRADGDLRVRRLPRLGELTVGYQVCAELLDLNRFFTFADEQGLPLPEDSYGHRKLLDEYVQASASFRTKGLSSETAVLAEWPPDGLLSALALAQHYGLPTRLLDWSWNAFVAAYFAASESVANARLGSPVASKICVWALNKRALTHTRFQTPSDKVELRLVTAPAAAIDNLRAQRGVFTAARRRWIPLDAGFVATDFEQELEEVFPKGHRYLWRVELASEHALEVLRLLDHLGVHAAAIYPGYRGAVERAKISCEWSNFEFVSNWPDAQGRDYESHRENVLRANGLRSEDDLGIL